MTCRVIDDIQPMMVTPHHNRCLFEASLVAPPSIALLMLFASFVQSALQKCTQLLFVALRMLGAVGREPGPAEAAAASAPGTPLPAETTDEWNLEVVDPLNQLAEPLKSRESRCAPVRYVVLTEPLGSHVITSPSWPGLCAPRITATPNDCCAGGEYAAPKGRQRTNN